MEGHFLVAREQKSAIDEGRLTRKLLALLSAARTRHSTLAAAVGRAIKDLLASSRDGALVMMSPASKHQHHAAPMSEAFTLIGAPGPNVAVTTRAGRLEKSTSVTRAQATRRP